MISRWGCAGKGEGTKLMSSLVGFPGGRAVENPPASAGGERDAGSVPGSGRRIDLGWEARSEGLPRWLRR